MKEKTVLFLIIAFILCILYNMNMKIITTTKARKEISNIINRVKFRGEIFAIGRRDSIDALLIRFPNAYSKGLNNITNINAYSKSFDFLSAEPEIYTAVDLKKKYD